MKRTNSCSPLSPPSTAASSQYIPQASVPGLQHRHKRARLSSVASSSPNSLAKQKPFKSPLKNAASTPNDQAKGYMPSIHAHTRPHQAPGTTQRTQPPPSTSTSQAREIQALLRDIDTLKRGAALLAPTSTAAAKLEALTRKWRDASRTAAELVFEESKTRVAAEGGMRGLKRRRLAAMNEDGFATGKAEEQLQDDDDDEPFTMSTMLRLMNVPAEMLGWDEHEERWV